jgi:hypothetical protein
MGRYKYELDTDRLPVSYKILVFIVGILFIATMVTSIGALVTLYLASSAINYWCITCFFVALFYVVLKAISKPLIFDADDEVKKEFRRITEDEDKEEIVL